MRPDAPLIIRCDAVPDDVGVGRPGAGEDSGGSARSRVEKRRFRPDARLNRGDWGWREAGVINNRGPCGFADVRRVYPDRRGWTPAAAFYFLTRITRARSSAARALAHALQDGLACPTPSEREARCAL